jgi:hypothetical protein
VAAKAANPVAVVTSAMVVNFFSNMENSSFDSLAGHCLTGHCPAGFGARSATVDAPRSV